MTQSITVAGAGILGLWHALVLAKRGHKVRLLESSDRPFANAASRYGGTMLAPDCEAEAAPSVVTRFGLTSIAHWKAVCPDVKSNGTLVLAAPRDQTELNRFARATQNYKRIAGPDIATLEPHLAGRFSAALMFESEAHLATDHALQFMLNAVKDAGVTVHFSTPWHEHDRKNSPADDIVIDCRGIAAKTNLPDLRGVRGERVLIKTSEVYLNRPVRLLHPRHPLYVVPWGDDRFVLGATVIESEDAGGVSVRSAVELLGAAYALHPAFSEAEIMDLGAGLRPAFADNIPRIIVCDSGRHLIVNGAYRHGFLLAPTLAAATADFLANGTPHDFIKRQETACPTGQL